MFAFGRRQPALVGVDIGSTAIRLVELSRSTDATASGVHLETYALEPLPPNAVVERKITSVQTVGEAIGKAVARSGTKARRAATAVSGSAVITKVISLPAALSDAEMEAQILLESDRYIPYPLEEVNLDFDVLGPADAGSHLVDVLLAASRRENVDDRVAALEIGGLTAAVVDVEACAMASAYTLLLAAHHQARAERTLAIADIGAAAMTLHVLHEGRTIYSREQSFGGHRLVAEVQRRYHMGHDEAVRRVLGGGLPDGYAAEVLGPFLEALAQQIGRALQFFYSTSAVDRVGRIILAGGVAGIRGIDKLVAERLAMTTVVADPFAPMSLSSGIEPAALHRDAPAMMPAVGLALRGFD
ncbi:MAG: pilus assembly protein PilM [Candidatus Thiosymbion ectosymbiont of Robbea hypermnestra]|nr:pilus assembly protein PilM [Candidatus Thiosymbion ectosymbiont of Robbea hypermnestra]